jgi:rubrerythrin
VGLFLAMARQALREEYPKISRVLEDIAWDEAQHAARFAERNAKVSDPPRIT